MPKKSLTVVEGVSVPMMIAAAEGAAPAMTVAAEVKRAAIVAARNT